MYRTESEDRRRGSPLTASTQPSDSDRPVRRASSVTLFLVSFALWASWLGWRVLDCLFILFPNLSQLEKDLRALPIGWVKIALLPVVLASWFAWVFLPLLILTFYASFVDRSSQRNFVVRLLYATKEAGGQVAGATITTILWACIAILFAYTSGLVDFLAAIAFLIVMLIELGSSALDYLQRRRRLSRYRAPNPVGRADV